VPEKKIKIVHLISGLGVGGAERMLVLSARYHDRGRFRLIIISLMSGGEMADDIRTEGVELHELDERRGRLSIAGFRRLIRLLRSIRPHVLQGHMFHSNILARIISPFLRGTLIISTRHIDQASLLRRVLNRISGFLVDGTVVFSKKVLEAELAENLFRRPIRLVPYGIEILSFAMTDPQEKGSLEISEGTFVWIIIGSLTEQKGFDHLLDAFKELVERGHDTALVIVGDGELRSGLESRAIELGIADCVQFTGVRRDVARLLRMADAFVLSSLWEGGPLVVLEAMLQKLPVVTTQVGDTSSMVIDDETGLIVKPGDTSSLVDAMARVMSLGDEVSAWGEKGYRRVVERYDYRSTQNQLEKFYTELLMECADVSGMAV